MGLVGVYREVAGDYQARQGRNYPHQGEVAGLVQIGSDLYDLEGRAEIAGFGKRFKKFGKKLSKGAKKLGKAAEKVGKTVAPLALQAGGMLLGGPAGMQAGSTLANMFFGSGGGGGDPAGGYGNLIPGVMPGMPLVPAAGPQARFTTQAGFGGYVGGEGVGMPGWVIPAAAIGAMFLLFKGRG